MKLEGGLLLRNRTSGIIALAMLPIGVAAIIITALTMHGNDAWGGTYALWPLGIALAHHLGWVKPRRQPARFDVSSRSVSINGKKRRGRVTRARILPQPPGRGSVVEIAHRFDPYPTRALLSNDDEARAFVRALGLDAREGTTRFRAPLSTFAMIAIIVAGTLASPLLMGALGLPFGFMIVLAMVAGLFRFCAQTITIGQDGILLEGFPRKRFLRYASVISIEREGRTNWRGQPMVSRGFWIRLESGEQILVDTTRERMRDYMFQGDHLFDAAVAAHALARKERPGAADVLARGGRPMKEWIRQLEGAREARYRVAAIPDEELALVLANPNAEKTARAGAAICLARAGEEARVRVRVAAEDIAEPDVRKAALAALEHDEVALAAALESLE